MNNTLTLTTQARDIIAGFEQMTIAGKTFSCPYFNNKRSRARAALAVMIGKGTPDAIVQEAMLLAKKHHVQLAELTEDALKTFLVEHNLGIDCSGFAYHVLAAEVQAKTNTSLRSCLSFPLVTNPFRRILAKLRPAENTNVKSLGHDNNSQVVELTDIHPGDMVILFSQTQTAFVDHVLLVTDVVLENDVPVSFSYAHSYTWPTDGKIHHGIKRGQVLITDLTNSLIDQQWIEAGQTNKENYTWKSLSDAAYVGLRRLRCL
ncbi:MAG: hypothetical protein GW939_03435 [Candidatus Magasanikbacteria bacterium]|uniref:Uncharacterized protein n=1 Tax=Candidatus Magasanikbacteria bacterium CG10_big_fil_rev_8_21_14_0_10_38_6 TaxID=1974647 RepID=A0A2M6P0Z6_9BACT|nr:hypothetical protein [Candidatus Magasanikbacteria bacterium]NCS71658.1 hypothetical protein [Candidatus Magasanikbacteria bacterium]PIR77229.1 MAG: hypothetical protein COU30_03610 [Candidatus Magasanikbacteria bacterium CG10_big_fil_rev_8_21_14_0_10_38_6]